MYLYNHVQILCYLNVYLNILCFIKCNFIKYQQFPSKNPDVTLNKQLKRCFILLYYKLNELFSQVRVTRLMI